MKYFLKISLVMVVILFSKTAFSNDLDLSKKFVNDLGNQIVEISGNTTNSVEVRKNQLIELVDSVIDSKWIAKFVLAKNYRIASKEQRSEFQELYREFMIHTYAPSFKGYNGESFEVVNALQQGKYFMVKCLFIPKEGPKVNVAFRLKKSNKTGKFSVLDVAAEGVSLIETQRSEFGSVISDKGIDGFLNDLSKRVAKLKKENSKK